MGREEACAQTIGGNATLPVSASSANIAFPAQVSAYPYVFLSPAVGSAPEIFYQLGQTNGVTATTSSPALPTGGLCLNIGSNSYIAAVAASAGTLRITQFSKCPQNIGGGGNGVITGGVSVTVNFPGSTGFDYSGNKPALPNIGQSFASTGLYPSYILITTMPANSNRANVDIENLSGSEIVVMRDDGTAASNAPPNNASVFSLVGGAGAGQQGGAWASSTFKGRIQIYAPPSLPTAFVTVMAE